jgi:hypothetical protein
VEVKKYHKIVRNSGTYYRVFNEATGFYEQITLTEKELTERLLQEAVEEVIEIDKGEVERAISSIGDQYKREIVQNYIDHLERIAESF